VLVFVVWVALAPIRGFSLAGKGSWKKEAAQEAMAINPHEN
jgi:hypothetical protein